MRMNIIIMINIKALCVSLKKTIHMCNRMVIFLQIKGLRADNRTGKCRRVEVDQIGSGMDNGMKMNNDIGCTFFHQH